MGRENAMRGRASVLRTRSNYKARHEVKEECGD